MKRLLREPLLHFLVIGALLFVAYGLMDRAEPVVGQIVVSQGTIKNLQDSFSRVWQRPPTSSELDGLIENYIREEVFAREAMALGLDRDDTVIRRRLRQKMEFIANDLAAQAEPSDAELEEFLAAHPDLFRVEPRYTFRQIYLNADRRAETLNPDVERMLSELNRAGATADFRNLGDATLLAPEWVDAEAGVVTRQFGEEFTRRLAELQEGRWNGPVTSGYGVHVVRVDERTPERVPELPEVRDRVEREWADTRRREDNERFYQALLQRYAVIVEQPQSSAETSTAAAQTR